MTRKCNVCAKPMMEGFVIDGGAAYYCSKPCLHDDFNEQDWNDMYADGTGDSYWTTWEDEEEEFGDDDLDDVSESSSMEISYEDIVRAAEGAPKAFGRYAEEHDLPHFDAEVDEEDDSIVLALYGRPVNKYHYEDYEDGTYFEDGE